MPLGPHYERALEIWLRGFTTWYALCDKQKDVPHSGWAGEHNYIGKDWQRTTVRIVTFSVLFLVVAKPKLGEESGYLKSSYRNNIVTPLVNKFLASIGRTKIVLHGTYT